MNMVSRGRPQNQYEKDHKRDLKVPLPFYFLDMIYRQDIPLK